MVKLTDAGKGAAYRIALGCTAEEAQEKGLVVVEYNYSTVPPAPIFGKYMNTETGAALEMLRPASGETEAVAAGGAPFGGSSAGGDKGSLVNLNDPVIHGTAGADIHADGSSPDIDALKAADAAATAEGATDPTAKKK